MAHEELHCIFFDLMALCKFSVADTHSETRKHSTRLIKAKVGAM